MLVPDQAEANRLYNRGYAGIPQKGGALRLSLIEATYLVEEDRLRVLPDPGHQGDAFGFREIFETGMAADAGFEIPLFAYRDLRARGRVVKHANRRALDFLVYAEGEAPPKARPTWLAAARSERSAVTATDLLAWLREAREEEAHLLVLLVDEEGDLTHYEIEEIAPRGEAPALDATSPGQVQGVFMEDRVIVWDAAQAEALHTPHFLGKPVPGGLQLSLVEAAALVDQGILECPGFRAKAERVQPDLDLRTRCYQDLRSRGLWVKTGFKFGTHFRLYDRHPDLGHAPWLVHAVSPDWESTWPEVSRGVRLAHSVRKRMVFSIVDDGHVTHVAAIRVRP